MPDTISVPAPGNARFTLHYGSIVVVSGSGKLIDHTRNRVYKIPQTLGPFHDDVEMEIQPTQTVQYTIFRMGKNPPIVVNDTASNHNIMADDVGVYLRMIGSGAKTVTFRPNATEALPDNGEWHVRNGSGSGDVTLTAGDGVTLNAPASGTLVLEPGMTVTVKRVGLNVFDVIGQTVAA